MATISFGNHNYFNPYSKFGSDASKHIYKICKGEKLIYASLNNYFADKNDSYIPYYGYYSQYYSLVGHPNKETFFIENITNNTDILFYMSINCNSTIDLFYIDNNTISVSKQNDAYILSTNSKLCEPQHYSFCFRIVNKELWYLGYFYAGFGDEFPVTSKKLYQEHKHKISNINGNEIKIYMWLDTHSYNYYGSTRYEKYNESILRYLYRTDNGLFTTMLYTTCMFNDVTQKGQWIKHRFETGYNPVNITNRYLENKYYRYRYSDITNVNKQSCKYDLNNSWQPSTYWSKDGYSCFESYSNKGNDSSFATMKVTIPAGISSFTVYYGSDGESNWDYTWLSAIDATKPTSNSDSGNVATSIGKQQQQLSYTYNISDTSKEHYFWVTYRKNGSNSSGTDRGYVLLPK